MALRSFIQWRGSFLAIFLLCQPVCVQWYLLRRKMEEELVLQEVHLISSRLISSSFDSNEGNRKIHKCVASVITDITCQPPGMVWSKKCCDWAFWYLSSPKDGKLHKMHAMQASKQASEQEKKEERTVTAFRR